MTLDKLEEWLEYSMNDGLTEKGKRDLRAKIMAKLRASEELARKASDMCARRTLYTEQLGKDLEDFRKAGEDYT